MPFGRMAMVGWLKSVVRVVKSHTPPGQELNSSLGILVTTLVIQRYMRFWMTISTAKPYYTPFPIVHSSKPCKIRG